MQLYFSPGACSLSPHIVARELGLELGLVRVDTKTKRTTDGRDYLAINPKGYVPAIQLDDGEILTEGPTIVQYLADQRPDANLVARPGTFERYRMQEMLGYINSEIHKTYSPLFNPATPQETRDERLAYLKKRYALLDKRLASQQFLFGERFTIADAYLFTVTSWAGYAKLDLSDFPHIRAFQARVAERPSVKAAIAAESGTK